MHDKLNVCGLLPAATPRCLAVQGALAGAGLVALAAAGTHEYPAAHLFVAVRLDEKESHVRALVVKVLNCSNFRLVSISSANADVAGRVAVRGQPAKPGRVGDQCRLAALESF